MKFRRLFSFPLLGKELIERAARPQTFWMRVVFGGLLLLAIWYSQGKGPGSDVLSIGSGGLLVAYLGMGLFPGIFLFLPPMMAGSVAAEKERDSLSALLLTDMSPTAILLQKYFAGLLPMVNLLLIAAPLGAIAYALGGVDILTLKMMGISLAAAVLQVGAVSLLASCFFRTTGAALVASYFLSIGGAVLAYFCLMENSRWRSGDPERGVFLPMTPFSWMRWTSGSGIGLWDYLSPLVLTAIILGLARFVFVRRAFLPPRPVVAAAFRRWDVLFEKLNRMVGGVRFGAVDRGELPQDRPVLWRELQRTALSKPQHVVRVLLPFTLPAVLGIGGLGGADITACIAMLVLLVAAVNTIMNERTNQTLETLLTTPLPTREILLEKYFVVRRYGRLLFIPVAIALVLFEFLGWHGDDRDVRFVFYAMWAGNALVLVPMLTWLAMLVALYTKTRIRALGLVVALVVGWHIVPVMIKKHGEDENRMPRRYKNTEHIESRRHPSHAAFGLAGLRAYIRARQSDAAEAGTVLDQLDMGNAFACYFGLHAALAMVFRGLAIRRAKILWRA